MKKIFIVLFLCCFVCMDMFSQGYYSKWAQYQSKLINKPICGVKLGVNCPRLYYTNKYISDLPHDFCITPSISFFVELPIINAFYIAPELNYQIRGGSTSYVYENDFHVQYKTRVNYLSLRIPLIFYITNNSDNTPYLLLSPDVGYAFGGKFSLSQPGLDISESRVGINESNYNPYYVGLLFGFGIRRNVDIKKYICVTKLDACINWGFIDTFSQSERDEKTNPTNIHAYNHQGERFSRGLEISISIGIISKGDITGCREFK